ncbi:hypothetical protein BDZ91DRAFT_723443, partial [Kalaharituber pfeilii]
AARHNGYYTRKWRGETSGANELVDDKEGSVLCSLLWKMENRKQSEAMRQCGTINKTATKENNRRNSEHRDELVKVMKNVHVGYLHRLLNTQNLSMLVTYRKKKAF